MVEAGVMRLVENGESCVFETVARVKFRLASRSSAGGSLDRRVAGDSEGEL